MKSGTHIEALEDFNNYPDGFKPVCGAPFISLTTGGPGSCVSFRHFHYRSRHSHTQDYNFCIDCLNHPKIIFTLFSLGSDA